MPTFSLNRRIPSCLVTKDLLGAIETYLTAEMREKLGGILGDKITYQISIVEKIGTETLANVGEYAPSTFSDGTKGIEIRWQNGYSADCRLDVRIHFKGAVDEASTLDVDCTTAASRETAIGIGDAILRLLESHRTYNWIFNPTDFPIVALLAGILAFIFLYLGFVIIVLDGQVGLYILSAAAFFVWLFVSAIYFRPRVSFDTRRRRLLTKLWGYFSLGTFGFVFFGTLLPLLRKAILGF